jgi:anti-sigma regulatory factor (Ser/Thr protein kinase)
MAKVHKKTQEISRFILEHVPDNPYFISAVAARHFDMTRQGINRHLKRLVSEGLLNSEGSTRNISYKLAILMRWHKMYMNDGSLSESKVWADDIAPLLEELPENVFDIWHYGFTEMFNNVIDHSSASKVGVSVENTAISFKLVIHDIGEGIFKKIQKALGLSDERHAVLELAKGKFTTDPDNHSGEGIFFSSRAFDDFAIVSGTVIFTHDAEEIEDWIHKNTKDISGTTVIMEMNNNAKQELETIFNDYTSGDDYGFTQTVVPVELAEYGDSKLVSRSQAKRLLTRIDKFKTVIFEFKGVDSIGQAFADEIFRVFQQRHPDIKLTYLSANNRVENMIKRALAER